MELYFKIRLTWSQLALLASIITSLHIASPNTVYARLYILSTMQMSSEFAELYVTWIWHIIACCKGD